VLFKFLGSLRNVSYKYLRFSGMSKNIASVNLVLRFRLLCLCLRQPRHFRFLAVNLACIVATDETDWLILIDLKFFNCMGHNHRLTILYQSDPTSIQSDMEKRKNTGG
jgi:hypothetical protein